MRNVWIAADVLSEYPKEQKQALEKFFSPTKGKQLQRAIHMVFTGHQLYKAHKDHPPNPRQAAMQIRRMLNALNSLTDELSSLSVDTGEAFHLVGQHRAEQGDFSFWELSSGLRYDGSTSIFWGTKTLCELALKNLPEVDIDGSKKKSRGRPKGNIPYHDHVLASYIHTSLCYCL